MISLLIYITSIFLILILSFFIFSRRYDKSGFYFSIMTALLAVWQAIQIIAIKFPNLAHQVVAMGLIVFSMLPVLLVLFVIEFIKYQPNKTKFRPVFLSILWSILLILGIFPGTLKSVRVVEGNLAISAGITYTLQSVLAVIISIFALGLLVANYRSLDRLKRQSVRYLFLGMAIVIAVGFVTGFVFANNPNIQVLAPISMLIMTALTAYTITRHKLFDIRLLAVRSLGYILTLSAVGMLYSLVVFGVFASNLGTKDLSGVQRMSYAVLAIGFGLSLTPLKRFFDRLTNKLFYKDAYDAANFLDHFNKTLVSNIQIEPLLQQSAEHINNTLKSEYCLFSIKETAHNPKRTFGTKNFKFTEEDISNAASQSPKIHQKLIKVDELEDRYAKLRDSLNINEVAVLGRLISTLDQENGQGYLILGQKKSGNPYNKQDLQVLEIVINELVIAIQNALRFEEIQAFNVTLQKKVDDATRQLRVTNDKLRKLDATKDEFISMASHQLRTPLTAIKGYVSMMAEGDAGKVTPQQKDMLGQTYVSTQRMVYLIADLLNVSRLRSGKFVIENKPTQLAAVIEGEVAQLTEAARGKKQTLTYKKPANFPMLMLDENKIRQVIMNFADNAIYYTPRGGTIDLILEDKGSSIEFRVVDNGIGVPKTERHHMFTKFYRARNAQRARPDGTGLGLFMAKKVIIAQGGSVIFDSTEGKGSTFGFTFPKAKLAVLAGKASVGKAASKAAK